MQRRTAIRTVLGSGAALALTGSASARGRAAEDSGIPAVARRRIPSTGELLPMIGLGTSRTFDVDPTTEIDSLVDVMHASVENLLAHITVSKL